LNIPDIVDPSKEQPMTRLWRIAVLAVLVGVTGCSAANEANTAPEISDTLRAHWAAVRRGDWKSAHGMIHPDVTSSGLTLERFTRLQEPRAKAGMLVGELTIGSSEQSGEDVIVAFDLVGEEREAPAAATQPRRRATMRKFGDSWKLATHDLLAARL
jgi:hypothetical protein